MSETITVREDGTPISYSYDDLIRYHGPGFPGGVAHAFRVMGRTLPMLGAPGEIERREITITTSFPGPGARDAFEMVTRAVTDGERYVLDPSMARPDRGRVLERYVFRLDYRGRSATVLIRPGFVTEEFINLARATERTQEQERRLAVLKREMADRLLAKPAEEVYDPVEL